MNNLGQHLIRVRVSYEDASDAVAVEKLMSILSSEAKLTKPSRVYPMRNGGFNQYFETLVTVEHE